MRRALLSLGLFVMLGGCPSNPVTNNSIVPTPTPTSTPQPTPWLTADPVCSGQITRGEWLICDNKQLNDLHRKLAWEWQTARQNATPERQQVLEDQLYALLSERDNCQDAACIATAYRRYLSGPPVVVKPNRRSIVRPGWVADRSARRAVGRRWRSRMASRGPSPARAVPASRAIRATMAIGVPPRASGAASPRSAPPAPRGSRSNATS